MNLQTNRFLSEFSTFGIGGPIRYFKEISSIEDAQEAFAFANMQHIPVLVIGKGSNCLFSDDPYEGLVLLNRIDFCTIEGEIVDVGAGFSFSLLGVKTAKQGLSGLEFACGIPATVGGAIFMNAGANGGNTSSFLRSVTYLHSTGEIQRFSRDELSFSYRKSPFQTMLGCIVSATFALIPKVEARKEQLAIIDYRMKTQPLKAKSIGCIFRNPGAQVGAGTLIDRCGLKGLCIGGAKISDVHANFIVNDGSAKSSDVLELIQLIQSKVYEQTGYQLEPEVWMIS